MLEECQEWRGKMMEAAAEGDETLLNKYLESGDLTDEEIKKGLRERALKNEVCLVTCGSAFKNKGVQAVLDAIVEYMPSPTEVPPSRASAMRRAMTRLPMTRRRSPPWPLDPQRLIRRQSDLFPGVFRYLEVRRSGVCAQQESRRAHRPVAADARQ